MKRSLILLLCGGLVLTAAMWRASADKTDAHSSVSSDTALVEKSTAAIPQKTGCTFAKGDAARYSFSQSGQLAMVANAPAAPESALTTAQLNLRALTDTEATGTVFVAQWSDAIQFGAKAPAGLGDAFLFRLGRDCGVTAFARGKAVDKSLARMQQSMLHELWFVVPHSSSLEAVGRNSIGQFTATLKLVEGAPSSGSQLERQITAYGKLWRKPVGGTSIRVIHSRTLVTRAADGWFESMEGQELFSGGQIEESESKLSVRRVSTGVDALSGASENTADYVWEDLLEMKLTPEAVAESWKGQRTKEHEALQHVTAEQMVDRFVDVLNATTDVNVQYRELKTFFEAHPESIRDFATAARDGDVPPVGRAPLFLALSLARVPEARDALMWVKDSRATQLGDRVRASFALATRRDVGQDLVDSLVRDVKFYRAESSVHAQQYSGTAMLALSVVGGIQKERQPDVYRSVRSFLVNEATVGGDEGGGPVTVAALGNLGDETVFRDLVHLTRSSNSATRARSTNLFRRVKPEYTNHDVREWLLRETDEVVKREIYSALDDQLQDSNSTLDDTLVDVALGDYQRGPPLLTKQSLVRLLGPVAKKNASVESVLVASIPRELKLRSGLYPLIAQYVDGSKVEATLRDAGKTLFEE